MFLTFFSQDVNYLNQIYNKDSPMRHLLDFEGLFVDFHSLQKIEKDYKKDNNSMVQQVIENMMNTEAISHLSSEEQEEYL